MDDKARRNLGAHYTSEENIQKLIKPLFLDELWAEFHKVKSNRNRLFDFHKRLRTLNSLDPACGCGNFLVITYRELRLLELEVLRAAYNTGQALIDVHLRISVDVDQFHGIELDEFAAQIAQVAMWLVDHQMNVRVSDEFGQYFARIPLVATPHIVHGNALRLDWASVLPPERCSYVLGNPPFVGAKYMDDGQRADTRAVFAGVANAGLLDLVAAWYVLAARYAKATEKGSTSPRMAFVSTNSITQGEQVGVLWGWLLAHGVHIHFAHRTFQWSNEARGVAAVHCVILGFGLEDRPNKTIYAYDNIRGEPHAVAANKINPYLVDAPDVVLPRRSKPICDVPVMGIGNKPIDDGNYLFTAEQRDAFLNEEPSAAKYFRRWLGSVEFINGLERWCLWLGEAAPSDLRAMPLVHKRIEAVKAFRLASKSPPTRAIASTPTRFHVEFFPSTTYLLVPEVSSERRAFVPVGLIESTILASSLVRAVGEATSYHFGIMTSTMHNAWIRYTCGRLKSDFRYSASIVYNNFPWPSLSDQQRISIEEAAQAVLQARKQFSEATLADLYDPITMPLPLLKAHQRLDRVVDAAYGRKTFKDDAERVAFLFERYLELTTLLPAAGKATVKRKRKVKVEIASEAS